VGGQGVEHCYSSIVSRTRQGTWKLDEEGKNALWLIQRGTEAPMSERTRVLAAMELAT
jgi:hypothetical protein